jgi:ATP-binding cassette subfamily C (CFTR/MRP) protein 4
MRQNSFAWQPSAKQNTARPPPTPLANMFYSEPTYLWVYATLCCSLIVFGVVRVLVFRYGSLRASRVLHARMFTAVVSAHTSFFETNHVYRILNRFARDTDTMDNQLALTFYDLLQVRLYVFFAT